MKDFSISVKFYQARTVNHGYTLRKRSDRYHIWICSKDPTLRQIRTFIHECIHVAAWVFESRDININREHIVAHKIELLIAKLWRQYISI